MTIGLDAIRECLDGTFPAQLATCAPDGTPNVTYVSEVHFVDGDHVALSFQFFNKTIRNIRENPFASVLVLDPGTGGMWGLDLQYLRSEETGEVFERMEMQLEAIASAQGLAGVFHLKAADIYRVLAVRPPA